MLRLLLVLFLGLLFSSPEVKAFGVRPIDIDLGGNRTYVGYGALTYQAAYESFGRHGDTASSQEWGSSADRQRANTKDEDPTGLLNEGFRYRDLDVGAFITRDPLGFVDGPNLYTYVVQNPWTYYDPLGLKLSEAIWRLDFWQHMGQELVDNARRVLVDPVQTSADSIRTHAAYAVEAYEQGDYKMAVSHASAGVVLGVVAVVENHPGGRSVRGGVAAAGAIQDGNRVRRSVDRAADVNQSQRRTSTGSQSSRADSASPGNQGSSGTGSAASDAGDAARGTETPGRGPDFVVTPGGTAHPIPSGATGPTSTRAPGMQFTGGSGGPRMDSRTSGVRFMDATRHHNERVIYMNRGGHTVDPSTGRQIPPNHPRAHNSPD